MQIFPRHSLDRSETLQYTAFMNPAEMNRLRQWFSDYCRSFYMPDPADQRNIAMKEEHTRNVCRNMAVIAESIRLDDRRTALAAVIALLHDVGRFPQYQRYRTFHDSISTNHAALGAGVIIEQNVLRALPRPDRELVTRAVTLHNVFSIPANIDEETLLLLRMVRDADKLDIWRVFSDYYGQKDEERPKAAALGLPENNGYSEQVLAALLRKELILLTSLTTLCDFKLLQLAWVYDLNFTRSFQLILQRQYIDRIAQALPDDDLIRSAVESVREYAEKKAAG